VREEYAVFRSFRRGATTEAVNEGITPDIIDANNCWRRMDQAGTSQPALSMREHYTDVSMTLKHRLKFLAVL